MNLYLHVLTKTGTEHILVQCGIERTDLDDVKEVVNLHAQIKSAIYDGKEAIKHSK